MVDDNREPWQQDEDEEEEMDETNYVAQKDAVLFAIDVSKSMLKPPPPADDKRADTNGPAAAALKCAYEIMQQRIISTPKDMMGVLLFNTEQSKFQDDDPNSRGSLAYPHCYLLNDLDIPSADDIKALKSIVEDKEEAKGFLVPTNDPVSMSNLLFCANQIFTTKAPNFGSRRLFIITDNDNPVKDKQAKESAQVRAKDLYDLGVIIELFPISSLDHEFDKKKFYDDIMYRHPNELEETVVAPIALKPSTSGGISLLSNLIFDVNSKQVAKRALFSHMPFEIGPGFKISVKGYNILQKQAPARNCFIWLGGERAQIAEGDTMKLNADDQTIPVEKGEIRKAYKFGGETVTFTPEEQKELKNFGPPGLRLIGVKPQSMLPFWASVKKSTFIYPSEEDYIGSTRVFSALWQKLLKDEKMGLGWFIPRKNAGPVLVAILPSAEKLDDVTNGQVFPAGLWLYPLPYADDIRDPPEPPTPLVAPDSLTDKMHKVVQQLQLPKAHYDPRKYPNPSLQWFYKILQAMALEEELPEQPEDKTVPKYKQIQKRAGEYINEWGITLHEEFTAWDEKRRARMKRGSHDEDDPPKKKGRASASNPDLGSMSTSDLKKLVVGNDLQKHTIIQLKELCSSKGLATGGKKDNLVERIEQWVEDNS